MTIIDVVRDRDEEHGAASSSSLQSGPVVVEMKERRNLKVLVFLATTFVVLVGAILRGTQEHYHQGASNSLFEQRSLLSFAGICASRRDRDFEYVDFYKTVGVISIAAGATNQYKTTVPRGTQGSVSATYNTGQLKLYTSYIDSKPSDAISSSDVECFQAGGAGSGSPTCYLRDETQAKSMYIWIEAVSATTFTLKIGNQNYV